MGRALLRIDPQVIAEAAGIYPWARIVDAAMPKDDPFGYMEITFEGSAFDPVPEGAQLPYANVQIEHRTGMLGSSISRISKIGNKEL